VTRTALITGGSGALGRHVVKAFLDEGIRVHVPVFDAKEIEALEAFLDAGVSNVELHEDADLTDPQTVDRIVSEVEASTPEGRAPDILLNLAGGFAMAPIHETDPDTWNRMVAMNATTAFLCSRRVFRGMRAREWGRIVMVSALPALEGGESGLSAYGASKAAVLNLTRTLAREGGPHGITANAVLPSIIDTPANRDAMPDADTSTWIPPEEIARVCLFLAGDDARVVNGAALTLNLGEQDDS
jgi:NAD(P)-dependent dehydrogenase (short-subunit alcohol dehydrogenase family)